jgi:hypothetical protein
MPRQSAHMAHRSSVRGASNPVKGSSRPDGQPLALGHALAVHPRPPVIECLLDFGLKRNRPGIDRGAVGHLPGERLISPDGDIALRAGR